MENKLIDKSFSELLHKDNINTYNEINLILKLLKMKNFFFDKLLNLNENDKNDLIKNFIFIYDFNYFNKNFQNNFSNICLCNELYLFIYYFYKNDIKFDDFKITNILNKSQYRHYLLMEQKELLYKQFTNPIFNEELIFKNYNYSVFDGILMNIYRQYNIMYFNILFNKNYIFYNYDDFRNYFINEFLINNFLNCYDFINFLKNKWIDAYLTYKISDILILSIIFSNEIYRYLISLSSIKLINICNYNKLSNIIKILNNRILLNELLKNKKLILYYEFNDNKTKKNKNIVKINNINFNNIEIIKIIKQIE